MAGYNIVQCHTEADLSRSTNLLINPQWLACLKVLSDGLMQESICRNIDPNSTAYDRRRALPFLVQQL